MDNNIHATVTLSRYTLKEILEKSFCQGAISMKKYALLVNENWHNGVNPDMQNVVGEILSDIDEQNSISDIKEE